MLLRRLFSCISLVVLTCGLVVVTAQAAPYAYIPNENSLSVSVIDIATNAVVASIPVGPNAHAVAVSRDGSRVYLSSTDSHNYVYAIDSSDNSVTATIPVGSHGWLGAIAITPDGAYVYVTDQFNNTVSVIATASNTVVASIPVPSPGGLAVTPDGAHVYVCMIGGDAVAVIDTATNTVTATVNIAGDSLGATLGLDAYGPSGANAPARPSPSPLATIPVGSGPLSLAITPDGQSVYVTNVFGSTVSVITTTSNTVTATIAVGSYPQSAAASPDGEFVYISNRDSNTLSVIATTTNTVTATVAGFNGPAGATFTRDGLHLYVANTNDNNVAVVDTVTNTIVGTPIMVGDYPSAIGIFIAQGPSPSGTALVSNPNPSVFGESVTLTATVSGGALPSGAATFFDGPTLLGTSALDGSGQASLITTALSAGSHILTATYAGDFNHQPSASPPVVQTVSQVAQAITMLTSDPPSPVYSSGGTFAISATGGASGNPVTFSVAAASAAVCSASGNSVTILGAGTCRVLADQTGNANYSAAPQVAIDVVIGLAPQAISAFSAIPALPEFVQNGTFAVAATGGASGNPLTFSIDAASVAVCSISGTTVTMLAAGACTVLADQAGNTNYLPAPQASIAVGIGLATQAINAFTAMPAAPVFVASGTFTVSASASSGLPVSFTIAGASTAVCSISGSTVTMLAAGTCTVLADQAGNTNYLPAPQASIAVAIGLATQAINAFTATPAAPVFVASGTFTVSASASSGLPVSFTIAGASAAVCSISGSTVTMLAAGTCTVLADQGGNTHYSPAPQASIAVPIGHATQVISAFSATPATPAFVASGTFTVSASASSGLPVSFTIAGASAAVCSISGSTVTMLAAGTCTVLADQAGDTHFGAAPQQSLAVTIAVAASGVSVSASPNPAIAGQSVTLSASVSGASPTGTLTFLDGAMPMAGCSDIPLVSGIATCTTISLAGGAHTISAAYAGDASNAASASAPLTLTISALVIATPPTPVPTLGEGALLLLALLLVALASRRQTLMR